MPHSHHNAITCALHTASGACGSGLFTLGGVDAAAMTGLNPFAQRTRSAALVTALAVLSLPASAGRAEAPQLSTGLTVAAAFADLGPATSEPFAEAQAVDVTEVTPELAPLDTDTAPTGTPLAQGTASFYGRELAGHRTANGEAFDPAELTAAHRTVPFGSRVRVTNQRNGMSVIVRINDRGPFSRGRLIDLSTAAAERIDMVRSGHAAVSIELL
ncbi:MAG: septal ring lytic transglycosylase RlpA family protein [Alteraurantiacibacter sp.]